MGATLNRAVTADGVIAYQDFHEVQTFHYLPARIDAKKDETLLDFKVSYYGINEKPYFWQVTGSPEESVVGGIVAGRAMPDITADQKSAIMQEIGKAYNVQKPNLVPIEIEQCQVQPVYAKGIADMGTTSSNDWPKTLKFGSTFNYNISSGNSLFAEMAGAAISGSSAEENPDVGINISGVAQFFGDPWIARIECDLSQVWSYTRTQVTGGIRLGWIPLTSFSIDKITQDLQREGIVKVTYIAGGGPDDGFGRQLLESTKVLFEAINSKAASGEGFFRFEPNPDPKEPKDPKEGVGGSLAPWKVSVNVGYGSETFSQAIHYENEVSFVDKFPVPISTSMNLALPCNRQTEEDFYDIQLKEVGCITAKKSNGLQSRLSKEAKAKNAELLSLYDDVKNGRMTVKEYADLKALLNSLTFTENDQFSEEQMAQRFGDIRALMHRKAA